MIERLRTFLLCIRSSHWTSYQGAKLESYLLRCAGWRGFTICTCDRCGGWIVKGGVRYYKISHDERLLW